MPSMSPTKSSMALSTCLTPALKSFPSNNCPQWGQEKIGLPLTPPIDRSNLWPHFGHSMEKRAAGSKLDGMQEVYRWILQATTCGGKLSEGDSHSTAWEGVNDPPVQLAGLI